MKVSSDVGADSVRLKVAGELDALSVADLLPVLDALLVQPQRRWILDLSQLRIIDSSGVVAIIRAFRRLRDRGGSMSVEGANEQPLCVLRLVRLDRVFGS
jgi:anti-sigma B factor antagonist